MRHGLPELLTQAWLVPCCTMMSPALQCTCGVVEQHVDLAFQHDGVVDRAGAVGEDVALVALRRRIDAHLAEDFVVVDALRHLAVVRREIDHAADRAVAGRRHAGLLVGLVAGVRQIDRRSRW